jgi:hypothetical protein
MIALAQLILSSRWLTLLIAVAMSAFVGFAGGFIKGDDFANAGMLRHQIADLQQAAVDKDRLQQSDAVRAAQAEQDRLALEIRLKQVLNVQPNDATCRVPAATLDGLCKLANATSGDCAPVPGATGGPKKGIRKKS